ncbi:bacillithiol system redox-active protein YtxJ [Flavobacteriaceae bacterium F89]|uniref:Bacillithiol system redox-active protein YtxJ n=1 Tax=Cerina litoralis TaxID=2874477 RepID=A0AAE3JPI2_9FLAO|nr:bacillithiol system redox-active protein YtxJ [Cerina litoralis]MCG2461071.1 bacillithiol system redox-active protein YtxJ [Cerina litoralis]
MGLFNSLFGSKNSLENKEAKPLPWIPLVSKDQLKDIVNKSVEKPQVIFKHSTTCGISRMALNQFTSQYNIPEGQLDLFFLDLKSYREVSNEVAKIFGIGHESPQLLIVKNGSVVAHASHGGILALDLQTEI